MGLIAVPDERLGEIVPPLAHSIRGSLGAITIWIQVLGSVAGPNDVVGRYVSDILDEAARVNRTVRRLQLLLSLRRKRRVTTNLREVVGGVVAARRGEADGRGLAVENNAAASHAVKADPEHLATALDELLSNAIRLSPEGGRVRIRSTRRADGYLGIHVDDDGQGVSQDLAGEIGRPFFSAGSKGTGLGLALASKICHLGGGRLEWNNVKAGGCRFSLILPSG